MLRYKPRMLLERDVQVSRSRPTPRACPFNVMMSVGSIFRRTCIALAMIAYMKGEVKITLPSDSCEEPFEKRVVEKPSVELYGDLLCMCQNFSTPHHETWRDSSDTAVYPCNREDWNLRWTKAHDAPEVTFGKRSNNPFLSLKEHVRVGPRKTTASYIQTVVVRTRSFSSRSHQVQS